MERRRDPSKDIPKPSKEPQDSECHSTLSFMERIFVSIWSSKYIWSLNLNFDNGDAHGLRPVERKDD